MDIFKNIQQAEKEGKLLPAAAKRLRSWLDDGFLPVWAESALEELVEKKAWEELNNRFYRELEFGTGGMRGRTIGEVVADVETGELFFDGTPEHPCVGSNYLNDFNIVRATIALYHYCEDVLNETEEFFARPRLVIAHDVRFFSRHFCELCASTWTELGGEAFMFDGPRSTPQLSFTVRHIGAIAGVVITASHNPYYDNGFKVYFRDGGQIVAPHDTGIIDAYRKMDMSDVARHLDKLQLCDVNTLSPFVDEAYMDAVSQFVLDPMLLKQNPPRVAFTALHGTGGLMTIPLLRRFGVDPVLVGSQMKLDGRFPTVKSPNPENPEALEMALKVADKEKVDIVFATDPDGDRMAVAARNGSGEMQLLTGNMIGTLLLNYRIEKMKALRLLPEKRTQSAVVIKTFVTTPMQDAIGKEYGLKVVNVLTGFKWIAKKMDKYEKELHDVLFKHDGLVIDYERTRYKKRAHLLQKYGTFFVFGGEESYGYLAGDTVRDKDANSSILLFCEMAASLKALTIPEHLDTLYVKYGYFLEDIINLYFEGASGAQKILNILASYRKHPLKEIDGVRVKRIYDFGVDTIHDADGEVVPKQDFFFIHLDNGYKVAIRASGTEPKMKIYLFAEEKVRNTEELKAAKTRARKRLDAIKVFIENDAKGRA
ncbi:MAG: phosphoglucomutase [Verrucomicrobia bacterium GWF2_51_19]|nr:MAG: phosphoglucomutase [Verrucomicrobia bacterium GWF2_51_19]HCJ12409.1 phospho-sugar mutase [Opitutae bacterium]